MSGLPHTRPPPATLSLLAALGPRRTLGVARLRLLAEAAWVLGRRTDAAPLPAASAHARRAQLGLAHRPVEVTDLVSERLGHCDRVWGVWVGCVGIGVDETRKKKKLGGRDSTFANHAVLAPPTPLFSSGGGHAKTHTVDDTRGGSAGHAGVRGRVALRRG